jgi:hypothetical protein
LSHEPVISGARIAAMPLTLTTENRARAFIINRLNSQRWWALPIVGEASLALVERIERRLGDRRGLEAVYPLPVPGVPIVVLVDKGRLDAAAMSQLLLACGGSPEIEPGQDVLIPYHLADQEGGLPSGLIAALGAWVAWLEADNRKAAS